ncbi:hypothetical protein [Caldovatus aquaticus]|uniref:Uncharacterized protein n=1 Tax=Caldovatus aquaticus TaxID=2865671 RepID=A0ABS7F2E4_9PROT|nr:hypothetical protein [Caldovatus aquaticus]MBW8269674.1 hypothetical protein [Caldovatus aquaticus]
MRTSREAAEHHNVIQVPLARELDPGAAQEARHGLRWLLGGVFAFFLGVVLGEVWPNSGTGPTSPAPRPLHAGQQAWSGPAATEVLEVGPHRLAVPSHLLGGNRADAARRSRGFVAYLAWADPENPGSEASRRCIETRPRCRDSFTMVVTANRTSAEQQWADVRRRLTPVGGGDPYGVRFFTAPAGPRGQPGGSLEFGERVASGQLVYGRCPRSPRDLQETPANMPLSWQTATVDPGANCTLTFDVRPGLSVTLMVRGEKLAEWRRAQLAAANLVEGFVTAGAAAERA